MHDGKIGSPLAVICSQLVCTGLQCWPRNSRNLVSDSLYLYCCTIIPMQANSQGKLGLDYTVYSHSKYTYHNVMLHAICQVSP